MRCSLCNQDGFAGPHEVRAHRKTAHPRAAKRRSRITPPPVEPETTEVGAETQLVVDACAVFDAAGLDADANGRVVAYLAVRYGPERAIA